MLAKNLRLKLSAAAAAAAVLAFSYANVFSAANVIKINGTAAEIPPGMGEIRERDGRTFVPVRFVSEFLKNDVWFDETTKAACVSSAASLIYIQNGNNILYVASKLTGETRAVQMDTAAYIDPDDNRTYLPIRFLAESLGYTVGWDEQTQTVSLDKL